MLGVLGAGRIGRAVGRHWVATGHRVVFGSRSPERLDEFVETLGGLASAAPHPETAATADIVLLAVPSEAVVDLLAGLGGQLRGKVVIDATNPVALSADGRFLSTLDSGLTSGRRTADLLPRSIVVRAFSHVMDELLWPRGTEQRGLWAMAIAGDDPAAKDVVAGLVSDTGFVPVDLGGLDESAPLDPGGLLFPHMYTEAEMRRLVERMATTASELS